eukprot:134958-Pyramimonas_sp.AAC.1
MAWAWRAAWVGRRSCLPRLVSTPRSRTTPGCLLGVPKLSRMLATSVWRSLSEATTAVLTEMGMESCLKPSCTSAATYVIWSMACLRAPSTCRAKSS